MAKQKRDAQATQAKIIKNSIELFSKNGFDATTIDMIADSCSVNKALLYYYYKNKTGLYEAVMEHVLTSIYDDIKNEKKCCDNVLGELKAFITTFASHMESHPYLPGLMLRELSDSGAHLPEMMFAGMRRLFGLLSDILERGEQEGVFKNVVPMIVHFMITGTINLLLTTQPLREKAQKMEDALDTCAECSMDEIAEYIFTKIKLLLEVSDEKNISCV